MGQEQWFAATHVSKALWKVWGLSGGQEGLMGRGVNRAGAFAVTHVRRAVVGDKAG